MGSWGRLDAQPINPTPKARQVHAPFRARISTTVRDLDRGWSECRHGHRVDGGRGAVAVGLLLDPVAQVRDAGALDHRDGALERSFAVATAASMPSVTKTKFSSFSGRSSRHPASRFFQQAWLRSGPGSAASCTSQGVVGRQLGACRSRGRGLAPATWRSWVWPGRWRLLPRGSSLDRQGRTRALCVPEVRGRLHELCSPTDAGSALRVRTRFCPTQTQFNRSQLEHWRFS